MSVYRGEEQAQEPLETGWTDRYQVAVAWGKPRKRYSGIRAQGCAIVALGPKSATVISDKIR